MVSRDVGSLRGEMLARRRAIKPEVVTRHSETVVQRVRSLPEFSDLAYEAIVGAYVGIGGEIDPTSLLEDPLLRTALPVTTLGEALRFVIPDGVLVEGPFGIRQPDRGVEVDPTDLAIVLVPLVAADRRGGRLGHGLGFYDRTFASLARAPGTLERGTGPLLIGLCHDLQVVEELDARPWDVPLDLLVTEVGVIRP